MNKATVIAIGAALLLVSVAAAAEVYRWVDAEGEVHYSDRQAWGAEATEVKVPEAGTAVYVAESAETQTVRDQQCELARKRLAEYEKSDVLFEEDEFGRRREISGEERIQIIARGQGNVEAFCGELTEDTAAPAPPVTSPEEPAAEAAAAVPAEPAEATGY